MYRIKLIIFFILLYTPLIAEPFRCVDGTIYADKNICDYICTESCEEMEPSTNYINSCNNNQYRGFFYYDKTTYALTHNKVFWQTENTVQIDDNNLNTILAGILRYYGENEAWIGAHDPNYSQNYNKTDTERFKWRNGDDIVWASWAVGQPDNKLSPEDIHTTEIFGEHWTYMNNLGEWFDTGGRGTPQNNYHEKKYSFVEFNNALDCISGTSKEDDGLEDIINGVCKKEEDCMSCTILKNDNVEIKKCLSGKKFNSTEEMLICPIDMVACDITTTCPKKTIKRGQQCCKKIPFDPFGGYIGRYICMPAKSEAICPSGGQCVNIRGKFYCSGTECKKISEQYVKEKDEYQGDQSDRGNKDKYGNCLGQLYLFSGVKKDCRLPSIRRPGINCCQSNSSWKPRFQCEGKGQLHDNAEKCNETCGKTCELLKKAPPDLKIDILGFSFNFCNTVEKELAFRRSMFPNGGNCKYIGKRCVERWSIGKICAQHKDIYCCYETPLAKIIQEAAHEQLNISWGGASNPNCNGLTPEQFQMLNLDNIDYSAWIEGYVMPALGKQASEMMKGISHEN